MKCIQSNFNGKISRVSDAIASEMVNAEIAKYVPKHLFKKQQKGE